MKKLTLQDIKEHFNYCIDEGLAIGEQEEIFLQSLYKKAEKMEEQQKEIERFDGTIAGYMVRVADVSRVKISTRED